MSTPGHRNDNDEVPPLTSARNQDAGGSSSEADPLLALRGSGRQLRADEHADDYVKRLREGWV